MRIQCREDDKQVDHLRSALTSIRDAKSEWPGVSTARRDELNGICRYLQTRHGAIRERLGELSGRAKCLTGTRLRAYEGGDASPRAALRRRTDLSISIGKLSKETDPMPSSGAPYANGHCNLRGRKPSPIPRDMTPPHARRPPWPTQMAALLGFPRQSWPEVRRDQKGAKKKRDGPWASG